MFLVALLLQIPILLVKGLVNDRKELSNYVKSEVTTSWGGQMEVTVPKLNVAFVKENEKKTEKIVKEIVSSEVHIESYVDTKIRHRSIYDIPVYTSDLTITGKFTIDQKSLEG